MSCSENLTSEPKQNSIEGFLRYIALSSSESLTMSQLEEKEFSGKGALWPFLKRIFEYSFRRKKITLIFLASIILVAITDAIFPIIWLYFLDYGVVPYVEALGTGAEIPASSMAGAKKYGMFYLLNGLVQVIGVFGFIKMAGYVQEHVVFDLRKEMFAKLQGLSFSYYDKAATGWLLSRITSDTGRVSELLSWGFLEVVWAVFMIFFSLLAMFIYSWKLALVVLLTIPFLLLVSVKLRLLILFFSRAARKVNSEITASYTEHINGVQVNKITAQETRVSTEFKGLSTKMAGVSFKAAFYTAVYFPLVIFIGSVAAAMVIYFGGRMAIQLPPGITVGVLAAFVGYATSIFMPILDLSRFYAMAQGSMSAGERIFELVDEVPTITDREHADGQVKLKGRITFDLVDFSYVPEQYVLKEFNLDIRPGSSVAIVGPTGEGKSTIINLISRFYEPVAGRILMDGKDYMDLSLQNLRSQVSVVLQSPHLFTGTVRENILYAREGASEQQLLETLKMLGADQFIDRLDEEVGEGGERLSMGERQLIAFARALITDPAVLIMDEATSSIDTITEASIQQGIAQMIKGRTSIIIAHRLSTIRNCDRILVIGKGQIEEDGSHQELMTERGHYYELYTKQMRLSTV